jgi:hypothetical protein
MTNKQLYNLVFENFVQAKRELLREGYTRKHLEEVDFNSIFEQSKKKMLEEKVKKLQRENEMLKKEINNKRGLKQESSYSAAGQGGQFQGGGAGSETFGKMMTKVASPFSKTAKADLITDRMIEKGLLSDNEDISKFRIKVTGYLKSGLSASEATKKALGELKTQTTLSENRRRRLQKEGLFDMFGKKGGQPQTQQREPKQVWLETLTKVFGSDFVNQNLSKMDDKSLSDFFKPINNLFIEGGGGPIFSGLMDVLERTDGINFKNLNQDYFRPLSSQLMLLNQFMNLFKIIETRFGNIKDSTITSLYKSNVTNPTQKEVLSQLVKKSKQSGRPISEVLGLISTYTKPSPQNLAENKRRRY